MNKLISETKGTWMSIKRWMCMSMVVAHVSRLKNRVSRMSVCTLGFVIMYVFIRLVHSI